MSTPDWKSAARRRTFRVEGLEPRTLLSMGTYSVRPPAGATPAAFASLIAAAAQRNATSNTAPNTPPTPTSSWLRVERYAGKFEGTYVVGRPRFTNQAATISVGGFGGSNQSLHATIQMVFFTPVDPAGAITGVIAVFPKNVATTGSVLDLDLTASAQPTEHGLPTHFTWTVDGNSGGMYTNAGRNITDNNSTSGSFGTGSGTLDVQYFPTSRSGKVGKAIVSIHGLINGGGIFSDIQTVGNRPNKP